VRESEDNAHEATLQLAQNLCKVQAERTPSMSNGAKKERTTAPPMYEQRAGQKPRLEVAFYKHIEPRTEGERHAEQQAWRSPGTEEQKIARMNEVREAFTGTRMSRGRGIGKRALRR
jgi:hypothetical protein